MLLSVMLLPENLSKAGWLIGTLLIFVIGSLLSFKAYRRLGYVSHINQKSKDKLISKLESIRTGRVKNITGVDVIQCNDNVWQEFVFTALSKAEIAIVDVSEITVNLAWEISQALKCLSKDRVIFVCDEEADQHVLLTSLNQLLNSIDIDADSEKIRRELVIYPSNRASVGPGRRRQIVEFSKRLRFSIADRLFGD
jgi:hypothetical protein